MKLNDLPIEPVWMETPLPTFARLEHDLEVDVVVVGGGLTGITTAYLLRREGMRVALLERNRLAAADTGRSTAHLTYVTDDRLHELVHRYGKEGAKAFWLTGATAIDAIEAIAKQTGADCEFSRLPGFLHDSLREPASNETERLKQDTRLALELGFDATFVDDTPLIHRPGVRFANQARFHPRKYLSALIPSLSGDGCYVFEDTNFEGVDEESLTVKANGKRIRCQYLVIATHNPLLGRKSVIPAAQFQTKLTPYTCYVLGARLPKGTAQEALFWDTSDPYDYLRIDSYEDHQYAIFGGDDVKTGQEKDADVVFTKLQTRLRGLLPDAVVEHRWMGQVIVSEDGLPFIGENVDREFIATGFCGNGFTFGTASAMIVRDRLLGRDDANADLFRLDRAPYHGGTWQSIKQNIDSRSYRFDVA